MRAIYPDRSEMVVSEGVEIHYEVYERDAPTIFFIPPAPITHSRIFKAQIPFLSRSFRIVTFDGRGNGRSGRVEGRDAHLRSVNVADAIAVLDATQTSAAVLVAHCHANWWAVELADTLPDRVLGWVALSPGVPYIGSSQPHWQSAGETWDQLLDNPSGWQLFNRHVVTTQHNRWIEFFFGAQLVEAHSTKQYEDAVRWGLESNGVILADSEEAQEMHPPSRQDFLETLSRLDLPVLVVHGDRDVCQHVDKGRELADVTGGELVIVEGGGHLALVRDPVVVNRAMSRFMELEVCA